jgi:hypothetical protein
LLCCLEISLRVMMNGLRGCCSWCECYRPDMNEHPGLILVDQEHSCKSISETVIISHRNHGSSYELAVSPCLWRLSDPSSDRGCVEFGFSIAQKNVMERPSKIDTSKSWNVTCQTSQAHHPRHKNSAQVVDWHPRYIPAESAEFTSELRILFAVLLNTKIELI